MRVTLRRVAENERGTFGELEADTARHGRLRLVTVERPWLENRPRVSCVPTGLYDLVPHSSARHPRTWALVGETVSHYPEVGKARSAILLHAANHADELAGCIAPGLRFAIAGGRPIGVLASRVAMEELRRTLIAAGGPHELEIVDDTRHDERSE